MQTLPATFAEAEAVQFARHWLANVSEAAFLDSGHPSLDPAAAHWFVRRIIKQYVESHPLNAVEMVEAAVLGWGEADLALRELIAEKTSRNEPLDAVLGGYNIRLIHPGIQHRRGKSKVPNLIQDIVIATLVLQLIERFPPLRPYRSQVGKKLRPSACSIVAQVLSEAGLHRGDEKAIQQICRRYLPAILHGYQWPDWGRKSLGFEGQAADGNRSKMIAGIN